MSETFLHAHSVPLPRPDYDLLQGKPLEPSQKQEYFSDYFKNDDGSYTVLLRILDKNLVIMELKFIVASRNNAKWIVKNWGDKAAQIYGVLYESLMEN